MGQRFTSVHTDHLKFCVLCSLGSLDLNRKAVWPYLWVWDYCLFTDCLFTLPSQGKSSPAPSPRHVGQ